MGEDLLDNWLVFVVSGREWCMSFLWGLGLICVVGDVEYYLYDGCVCSLLEVVFWYGGEVEFS